MDEKLFIRAKQFADKPFVELDKETLQPKEDQQAFTGDGVERLLWSGQLEGDAPDGGRRWVRSCPMFHDQTNLHVLVPYFRNDYQGKCQKLVLETYSVEGNVITFESELELNLRDEFNPPSDFNE